jgi:predicted DNA-binding transcriptional regulator AlpA
MNALMRTRDLMEFMNISRSTLWRLTQLDDFPRPVILMGLKRWRQEELESWLSTRRDQSVTEVSPEC